MSALALLDTSVVLDMDILPRSVLPDELAICAITLAELAAGPSVRRRRGLPAPDAVDSGTPLRRVSCA